ncbi:uncharacterized protein Z518_04960 [Rhinocladiella mackenziei CBS 650.93]|uniref:Uncharacterized protein n=1 Tax=Rhinocladiella mackenziei CBS 650.93 TaxID=1442369 RepID=A0A0D2IMK9_9EURO|nr:uncharacterized protein Z518_04960 [Rhinocladiella mackenziei CBS 650.93]KIX06984.1 hypothetical protein Z518_04960 [Rhinocladiella mackenziei CBS 650.93]
MNEEKDCKAEMLDSYLYQPHNIVDRLTEENVDCLKSDKNPKESKENEHDQKHRKKGCDEIVRKLEKELDAMTNPIFLGEAREDQQNLKDGTSSYSQL